MEVSSENDHFKHIPFRCYIDDGYRQKLIKPVTEDGKKKTLKDLLIEMFPDKSEGELSCEKYCFVFERCFFEPCLLKFL